MGTDATRCTVDLVTLEKLVPIDRVEGVVGTVAAARIGAADLDLGRVRTGGACRAGWTLTASVVVVACCGIVVVAIEVAEVLDVVADVLDVVADVRVKTSTRRSTGLDHIKR